MARRVERPFELGDYVIVLNGKHAHSRVPEVRHVTRITKDRAFFRTVLPNGSLSDNEQSAAIAKLQRVPPPASRVARSPPQSPEHAPPRRAPPPSRIQLPQLQGALAACTIETLIPGLATAAAATPGSGSGSEQALLRPLLELGAQLYPVIQLPGSSPAPTTLTPTPTSMPMPLSRLAASYPPIDGRPVIAIGTPPSQVALRFATGPLSMHEMRVRQSGDKGLVRGLLRPVSNGPMCVLFEPAGSDGQLHVLPSSVLAPVGMTDKQFDAAEEQHENMYVVWDTRHPDRCKLGVASAFDHTIEQFKRANPWLEVHVLVATRDPFRTEKVAFAILKQFRLFKNREWFGVQPAMGAEAVRKAAAIVAAALDLKALRQ
jgi:hypothetical protein